MPAELFRQQSKINEKSFQLQKYCSLVLKWSTCKNMFRQPSDMSDGIDSPGDFGLFYITNILKFDYFSKEKSYIMNNYLFRKFLTWVLWVKNI